MPRMKIASLNEYPNFREPVVKWLKEEWGDMPIIEFIKESSNTSDYHEKYPKIFIALNQGQLLGTISLLEDDMKIRPSLNPWLGCLYVDPNFRHQGIGRKLFIHAQRYAKGMGISNLYLFTSKLKMLAIQNGWISMEELFFEGENVWLMCKTLDDE